MRAEAMKSFVIGLIVAGAIATQAENLLPDSKISKDNGWSVWCSKPVKAAGGDISFSDGAISVKSPTLEKQDVNNIQLIRGIDLENGKAYSLKFKAKADKPGKVSIAYILKKSPYTKYAVAEIDLEAGEKSYDCTLNVKGVKSGEPETLRILFGALKDVSVTVSEMTIEPAN